MKKAAYENQIELTVPSDPGYMRLVRSIVGHMATLADFDSRVTRSLILATDEACSNIIKYSYLNDYRRKIVVRIMVTGDRLEIFLRDFGRKFSADRVKAKDLSDIRPGGLGIHIMKRVMDEMSYTPKGNSGTELKMVKYRKGPRWKEG